MYLPMEEGEEVVMKVHRHWLFIVTRIIVLALLLVAPLLAAEAFRASGVLGEGGISGAARMTLWALWGLVLWVVFWQFWTTYYMDIWVITNRRIIDIDYERLFDRNIAILRLDRVQDITTHVQGVVGTLLKYGKVVVQTAGSDKEFVIDQIAHPEALRDAISFQLSRLKER
ncbi:MAG: PH domain-containing protein [Candidatus Yanofskybacteria bacterium]|nr:PH domain-containing protein [Candidatus Yanofskybacteria bacterium]